MKFTQVTKRLVSIGGGALLVFGAIVIYVFLIQPIDKDTQEMHALLLSQEVLLETQKSAIEQAEKLIKEYEGERRLQDVVSEALPEDKEVASAVAQIGGLAAQSGLRLQALTIAVSGNREILENESDPSENAAPRSLVKPIGSVRMTVSAKGTYEDLKHFLENVENNLRVFDVERVSFTPPGRDETGKLGTEYSFSFDVVTYYQGA